MNKKLFGLFIFAIALGLVSLFAVPKGAMAASDNYNEVVPGAINLIGVDEADNNSGAPANRDRDMDRAPVIFQSYGLHGDWAGEN